MCVTCMSWGLTDRTCTMILLYVALPGLPLGLGGSRSAHSVWWVGRSGGRLVPLRMEGSDPSSVKGVVSRMSADCPEGQKPSLFALVNAEMMVAVSHDDACGGEEGGKLTQVAWC